MSCNASSAICNATCEDFMKAVFRSAFPYQKDALQLPVPDVENAVPFYETVLGFQVISRSTLPHPSVLLARDGIRIGLAENGGDPTQDGCFFEVDDAEAAFAELRANGLERTEPAFRIDRHDGIDWKVFFVVAPDGLCYCLGQRQAQGSAAP
jgi:lactoylglutathione lyase